ncbi:MAG TPA: DUF4255 domain-containing protein [Polyangia bacterium]|jgi:hypothetical protein
MPTDLASLSRTLRKLIVTNLTPTLFPAVPAVTFAPPDATGAANNLISAFLYHILESPELKNAPPASGTGPVPIQQAPMGLICQYLISVVHDSGSAEPSDDAETEQLMIGLIARTIHDYPVITPSTTIFGMPILDSGLASQNNSIELNLRPATSEEQFAFWSTQREKVVRLSLFVEARVVVLEPLPPVTFPGIVLTVGNFVFPGTGPQLVDSRGVTWFLPPLAGSILQSVPANPARATMLPRTPRTNPPTSPVEIQAVQDLADLKAQDPRLVLNASVILDGEGLTPGQLLLVLSQDQLTLVIDATDPGNADWQITATSTTVQFSVHRNVIAQTAPDTVPSDVLLVPGSYVAIVRLVDPRFDGKPRSSNETTFTIGPQILTVAAAGAGPNVYTLRIAGDYFTDSGVDIDLAVNGAALTQITSGTLVAGQFIVADAGDLTFMLPTGAATPGPGTPLAVRLVVNGINGTPAWLTEAAV